MDLLIRHPWPGNVRELMNAIERAVVLSRSACLDEHDFDALAGNLAEADAAMSSGSFPADVPLERIEREAIVNTLASANGNKSEAARRLGITRKTLREKVEKIQPGPFKGGRSGFEVRGVRSQESWVQGFMKLKSPPGLPI